METISYLIITLVFWGISFLFIFIFFIIFFYGSLGPFQQIQKKTERCLPIGFKNVPVLSVLLVGPPQCRVSRGCSPLPYNYYYYAMMCADYGSVLALHRSLCSLPYIPLPLCDRTAPVLDTVHYAVCIVVGDAGGLVLYCYGLVQAPDE